MHTHAPPNAVDGQTARNAGEAQTWRHSGRRSSSSFERSFDISIMSYLLVEQVGTLSGVQEDELVRD